MRSVGPEGTSARAQTEILASAGRNFHVKDGNRVSAARKLKSIKYKRRAGRFSPAFTISHGHLIISFACDFAPAITRALRARNAVNIAAPAILAVVSGDEKETRQVLLRAEAPRLRKTPYGRPIDSGVSCFTVATVYMGPLCHNVFPQFSPPIAPRKMCETFCAARFHGLPLSALFPVIC